MTAPVPALVFGALAQGANSAAPMWGWLLTALILAVVTASVTTLLVNWRQSARYEERIAGLSSEMSRQAEADGRISEQLDSLLDALRDNEASRAACELRAAQQYATQKQLITFGTDQSGQYRSLCGRIDKLTEISAAMGQRVASIEGRLQSGQEYSP